MKKIFVSMLMFAFVLTSAACNDGGSSNGTVRPSSGGPTAPSMPAQMKFDAMGAGPVFQDARQDAFKRVLEKAAIHILGKDKFDANKSKLTFLTYRRGRQFVMGTKTDVAPNKKYKLTPSGKDDGGNTLMKIDAWIYMHDLKNAIEERGLSTTTKPTHTPQSTKDVKITFEDDTKTTTKPTSDDGDLSDVDISAMQMLVFYKPKGLTEEQKNFSKLAVKALNRGFGKLGLKIKDLETVETLAKEKALLIEESEGSVGLGLLLAQKIAAELYAEVWTTVGYSGNTAHATLHVKIFVRSTGDILTEVVQGGRRMDGSSRHASVLASLKDATTKAMKKIEPKLKKYVKDGRVYTISLLGVQSYGDASKFSRALKKVKGTVNVTLHSHSKSSMVSEYFVQFKGNPTDLLDSIFDTLPDQPGFEALDLDSKRGNELIFRLD